LIVATQTLGEGNSWTEISGGFTLTVVPLK